jgi:hypothetical protein
LQLSSLVRTDTTSKWFATNPGPDASIQRTVSGAADLLTIQC